MKQLFIALVFAVLLSSCNTTSVMSINEECRVVRIEWSSKSEYKYFVVTQDYNFWTDTKYKVGDKVGLVKL